MSTKDSIATVLALVSNLDAEQGEATVPVPPNCASVRAQEAWYATLAQVDLETAAEWRLLESIVEVITQHDLVRERWLADGCPVTSLGSMQQEVEAPALSTMRALRTQEAALWKQLALPTDNAPGTKRRPGRPTRAESAAKGKNSQWGTR